MTTRQKNDKTSKATFAKGGKARMFGEHLSGRSRHLDDRHGRLESTR